MAFMEVEMHTTNYYRIRRIARVLTAVLLVVAAIAVVAATLKVYSFLMGWGYAPQPYRGLSFMLIIVDFMFGCGVLAKIVVWLFNVICSLQEEK